MSKPSEIAKRGVCKATLTRLKNKLTPEFLGNSSEQMLRLLEDRAKAAFGEYENLNLCINDGEDPTATENCFFFCVDAILSEIASREQPHTSKIPNNNAGSVSKLKLPNVQMEPFDGNYLNYCPFIEMFTALIDNDQTISEVQKFFYLRSFLRGEAYDLIKNMPVVGSSYFEALTILKTRYDNKYRIIFEHIFSLFDLESMGGQCNASALRQLISQVKQHIAALKNLGQPVDQWDSLLVCILIRKIDAGSTKAYYLQHDKNAQPTVSDFLNFLELRAFALENTDCETPHAEKPRRAAVVAAVASSPAVKEVKCTYCGKPNHKLFNCPSFMLASVDERLKFVNNNALCKICLNPHKYRCKFFFKCQKCKQSHNSLLHRDNDQKVDKKSGEKVL